MTVKRQRFKQSLSLKDRLTSFAKEVRAKAADMPPGPEKDDLLRRAGNADTAARLDEGQFAGTTAAEVNSDEARQLALRNLDRLVFCAVRWNPVHGVRAVRAR